MMQSSNSCFLTKFKVERSDIDSKLNCKEDFLTFQLLLVTFFCSCKSAEVISTAKTNANWEWVLFLHGNPTAVCLWQTDYLR